MSALEKILRKVEQDRSRGNDERALARLKDALAAQPQELVLVREAASLCFQIGRGFEGVGILRSALRRRPDACAEIVQLAQEEFQRHTQLELAEFLFDTYLSEPDLERARDVVKALEPADLTKLLGKLQAKVQACREELPEVSPPQDGRECGLLLAEALVLAALKRWPEMAASCARILDLDAKQTETLGRLCRLELQSARDCLDLKLVLGRCYLNVQDVDRALEQLEATAADPRCRARVLQLLALSPSTPAILAARARFQLLETQYDAAHAALEELLGSGDSGATMARQVLESVPAAPEATDRLRQLYAQVLAGTRDTDLAVHVLEQTRQAGGDPVGNLHVADKILEERPRDAEALLLRARLSLDLKQYEEAAQFFRRALEVDPERGQALRLEITNACAEAPQDVDLARLLVGVLIDLELPREATAALLQLRATRQASAAQLHELALGIASRFGLDAELLGLFVECAVDLEREDEARAAVAHYHATPGTRTQDFTRRLQALLEERPELGPGLARVLDHVPVPPALRLTMVRCSLAQGDPDLTLRELNVLVAEEPELRDEALVVLEAWVRLHGDVPRALELAAELLRSAGRFAASAELLARALRAEPAAADRISRRADRLFTSVPQDDAVWRPLVLALLDTGRHRHARDLCYRAAQSVPFDRQGFLHVALGCIHLETKQVTAATNAFESSLLCRDVLVDRVIAGLRRVVELDAHLGHARYVLARALLLQEGNGAEAIILLSEAVRLDQMLVDLVLETLQEHAATLEGYGPALALEGGLWLRRGERARGVELLDQALRVAPDLGPQILTVLQVEWDRDPESPETGMALARALVASKQERRACRLLAEISRRFPAQLEALLAELEHLLEMTPLPEAHRTLWDIHLARGDREAALQRARQAVETAANAEIRRELLDSAQQRFPGTGWIVCRLAELEIRNGNETRGEALLRELLENDLGAHDAVLAALHDAAARPSETLGLLEIDTLLAAERWTEAHTALGRLRESWPESIDAALVRLRVLASRGDLAHTAALDLAFLLQGRGEFEEAIAVLEKALEHPDHGAGARASSAKGNEIRLLLASLYVDLGRVGEGKELLASVLQDGGGNQEAYGFLERLSAQGLATKIEQLRETIERAPSNLRARLEMARLSLLACDFSGARDALGFPADGPALEAARRFLLARSYADSEQPHLAAAVTRSIDLSEVSDPELRRNVVFLRARCSEQLGRFGEAHVLYLRLVSEFPDFKAAQERTRSTYQMHLETSLAPRALVLEKRTDLGSS